MPCPRLCVGMFGHGIQTKTRSPTAARMVLGLTRSCASSRFNLHRLNHGCWFPPPGLCHGNDSTGASIATDLSGSHKSLRFTCQALNVTLTSSAGRFLDALIVQQCRWSNKCSMTPGQDYLGHRTSRTSVFHALFSSLKVWAMFPNGDRYFKSLPFAQLLYFIFSGLARHHAF